MLSSEDILFLAFRYALGRKTYVVSEMVETLKEGWEDISDTTKRNIHKEIQVAISNNLAGHFTDIKQWESLLKLPVSNA